MQATRNTILLYILFLGTACDSSPPPPPVPPHWQTISAGKAFTFKAPPDVKPVPVQGIDSFVGHYQSQQLNISFDFGRYSDPLERDGIVGKSITVDGKHARLVRSGDTVAIHFPKVSGEARLTMQVELLNGADPEIAQTLLRSIRFR